jgi:hypothetical protein
MTEEEWLESNRPLAMLRHLLEGPARQAGRKFRLFACSCARRLPEFTAPPDRRIRDALRVAERYAEGTATRRDLERARWAVQEMAVSAARRSRGAQDAVLRTTPPAAGLLRPAELALALTAENDAEAAWRLAEAAVGDETWSPGELLREFFGNPFRPAVLPHGWSRWNDGVVAGLARQIYEEQRWADLPVLADALEEAGCSDETILGHCRSAGGHRRGCWVLDLLRVED